MISAILFFIFLLVILHYFLLHHRKFGKMINLIPGPEPLPILGNIPAFHNISPSKKKNLIFL